MESAPQTVVEELKQFGQEHLLRWWDDLSADERNNLLAEISAVDLNAVSGVWQSAQNQTAASSSAPDRASIAKAPSTVIRQPSSNEADSDRKNYAAIGEQALTKGSVAVITVAGGQGSRLGFDHPKGMFPIGPVTDRTLFQIFAEQILARQRQFNSLLPWLIMTSSATHTETVEYFERTAWFGLDPENAHFFQQGSMPAVDAATGRILMSTRSSLCLSPDGHGGLLTALRSSGLLESMISQGIEHFYYHQVDNPTAIICDPILIGAHVSKKSELTTNVVEKQSPMERMGVLVDINGRLEIIEYSELTEEQASRHDESGQWIFWAGNTAIHVFSSDFLERLTDDSGRLPLHLANKKVPHLDENGKEITPDVPNANKFERFIFDALPVAEKTLIVEGDRAREFNPVKNAEGNDSPATARSALSRIGREWLREAGHEVNETTPVEISPLTALSAAQLSEALRTGAVQASDICGSPATTSK